MTQPTRSDMKKNIELNETIMAEKRAVLSENISLAMRCFNNEQTNT